MIKTILSWFQTKRCGLCDGELGKGYGEIRYKTFDRIETMKICKGCVTHLENEHEQFAAQIDNWKKHEAP